MGLEQNLKPRHTHGPKRHELSTLNHEIPHRFLQNKQEQRPLLLID